MFARATIFAIGALVMITDSALAQTTPQTTCKNTAAECGPATYYTLSSACECCPALDECDAKYFGQFCIPDPLDPKAPPKLDVRKLPLSCPKRQAIQTNCPNPSTCKPFEIRQDSCECCPVPTYECTHFAVGGPTDYCDASSKLIKERLAPSCPQKFTFTATTCPATQCNADWELPLNPLCDCCPKFSEQYNCAANASGTDIAGFKTKYCSGTAYKLEAFGKSCPLPATTFDATKCTFECIKNTFRSFTSCDCCPYVGEECLNGDLFCTNNKPDAAKIPQSCGIKVQPLCNNFCPPSQYTLGANCDCCPIIGQECSPLFYGKYCTTAQIPQPDPSKIPDGCPIKDLFNAGCKDPAGQPLICQPNTFKTTGCGCCPVVGKECDPLYNGAYCVNNVLQRSLLHPSCPQVLNFKDCSKFTCPDRFTKSDNCECCPPLGEECVFGFCDSTGLFKGIPNGCPQTQAALQKETECSSTKFIQLFSTLKPNQYVNTDCQVCPFIGEECTGDNEALFCVSIAGFKTPDLTRIPSNCPQVLASRTCDPSKYTKNLYGECCPLLNKEGNAEYNGKYKTPDGKLIYTNIPAGCPQFDVVPGCSCSEGFITPVGAENCECCPFPGFECDKRYNNKFCDFEGNLILANFADACKPKQDKQQCDARYYFTGKDGFTCCPFEGKECSPVYGSKYCNSVLGNAPWRQTVDPLKIPLACKVSSKQSTCSSRFELVNGSCCPFKTLECSVFYDNNQFCTNGKLDYSKIPFGCSQFEDVCFGANFRKVTQGNTFIACCPTLDLTDAALCVAAVTKYGAVDGKGGLYCGQDAKVLPEVIKVCSAVTTAAAPSTFCGTDQSISALKYTFTDAQSAKHCCPFSGFECIGDNKSMYCDAATGAIKNGARLLAVATNVPLACPNNKTTIVGSGFCNTTSQPGKDLVIKQEFDGAISSSKECAQCPLVGKECTDETNFAYTADKNAYCSRVQKANGATGEFEYTLNIMSINKLCPQRINGFSKIVATHFEKNSNSQVYCPTSFAQGLGVFYSSFAASTFTLNPTLIPACDTTKLAAENCASAPACPAGHNSTRIKTGSITEAEKCLCCPLPDKNLCDPIFNNQYCLDGNLKNNVPDQCLPPSNLPTTRNEYFKCPKGVACGEGWVDSAQGCDCCPDFANKYNVAFCQAAPSSVLQELHDILCKDALMRPAMDVVKLVPASCTMTDTTRFPLLPVNDIMTRTGVQCPRVGTECDTTRQFADPANAFCKVDANFNTILNVANIPAGCDQKTNTGVCPVDACDPKYVTVPDKDQPDKPQYCQCCPKIGYECDPSYDNKFCDPLTKQILYDQIPSGCDQQKSSNACNFEFFFKNSSGSCCPIPGKECIKEMNGQFCDDDGTFKKANFLKAKCDVPQCSQLCVQGYLQNGCYCCPVPYFELDKFYAGAYTGSGGIKNIPDECRTLNLFPFNPWDKMSTLTPQNYQAARVNEYHLPVGTLDGYKHVLNVKDVKDVFLNSASSPVASLFEFIGKAFNEKINWVTQGRVFGVEQANQIYTILNTPAIVASVDAEIAKIEVDNYSPVPADLWLGLGGSQLSFKSLSQTIKRYMFVTFWFNKPINECSKFGQQDRFFLGETNWLPAQLTLETAKAEYTLSRTIEELNHPKEFTVDEFLKVTKTQNLSLVDFLKLDKVNRVHQCVKANLPATFDVAWHETNKASPNINTFDTFFKSSVYWFDAKYPGLQIPPLGAGETTATAPVNAARTAVYTAYMAKIEPANLPVVVDTTDSSYSNTFEQYRMDYYMDLAVKEYVALNPTWDPHAYALKYPTATLQQYVYPAYLQTQLRSSELNKIIDMVKEAEGWVTKYAAFIQTTGNPTLNNLFQEKVLGSVLNRLGIPSTDVQENAGAGKYSWKQALFTVCSFLVKNGQTLSDVYVPEYASTVLDPYYLSSTVIQGNNFSARDVAYLYEGALKIKSDLTAGSAVVGYRNADLLAAFDGLVEKLNAATVEQKAGRLMLFFYQKTRATLAIANQVNGVIKPKPFSRYFNPIAEAAVNTGFTAAKVSEIDLYSGRENAFSIALKVQTETFKADLTASSAFIAGKYPQLKAAIDAAASLNTNDLKAEGYAYHVATADIGLKPRSKSQIEKYFPGTSQSYLTRAKISEKDFYNIDQKVTATSIAAFRFNQDFATKLGITADVTQANGQEIVLRVNTARQYAEERIAYYEKLYKMSVVNHLVELGVTTDMLSSINLSFDQVAANQEQWNTELIGNMLFSQRYGKICKYSPSYDSACVTGWQSPLAIAEITIPLGLTRDIAMTKQYSLLEVMHLSRQYVGYTSTDARETNNIQKLAANSDPSVALNLESVQNYFDGQFLTTTNLVERGYVCQAAISGLTGVTEKLLFTNGPKVCDYLSNQANTDVYRASSITDKNLAPRTNVDVIRSSFQKKFTKANFESLLDAVYIEVHGGTTAAVHADYKTFGELIKAAAQFPAFCSVEDNKLNTVSCEKQIIGFLAVVGHYSAGFKNSLSAATTGCTTNTENTCLNVPAVETLEYHYISKLMKNSGILIGDAIYKAWGMGQISGPREFLEFFSRYPEVSAEKTGFTKPIEVPSLLEQAKYPEMNWATAFYRWFQPSKVNFQEQITEAQDQGTGAKKYFYVENSYLVPSFDTLMLGNFGDLLVGSGASSASSFTSMFPTKQNGFRGIMKVLLGANCHSDAGKSDGQSGVILAKTQAHTDLDKIYSKLATQIIAGTTLVADPYNENKDCSAVGATSSTAFIPNIPKFNRKNYYAPTVTTIEEPLFTVRQFQGTPGQCFNVHIETPYSIFSQDAYARCVAVKKLSTFGQAPSKGAAQDFSKYEKFTYYF